MEDVLHILKVQPGVEHIPQFAHERVRLFSDASVKIDKVAVEIVEHFKISVGRFVKKNPSRAAEHFNIPFVFQREPCENFITKRLFSANPCHKAVDRITPFSEALCVYETEQKNKKEAVFHVRYSIHAKRPLLINLGYSVFLGACGFFARNSRHG